jgi:hypothetical protein
MLRLLDRLLIGGALFIPYLLIGGAIIALLLPGGGGGGDDSPVEYIVTVTRK